MMNIFAVQERLQQRPPFQMIEKVLELIPGKSAVGVKCVSVNEPYFAGHFPQMPVMPGVMLIETCAQLCSLVTESDGTDTSKLYMLLKVQEFKFLKPVLPGDTLTVTAELTKSGGPLTYFDVKIQVDDTVHAKGTLLFTAVEKTSLLGEQT